MTTFRRTTTALAVAAAILGAPAVSRAEAASYKIDAAHSSVIWRVLHMNTSNAYGRFNDIDGKVVIDEADPSKSSLEVIVKADSVDSANDKRDQHLKGPDFLNAKQFPEISIKSEKVSKVDDKTYAVDGKLTLRGVTKPVSFKFTKTGSGKNQKGQELAGGEAEFSFKRSDFGITYGPKALGDEITIIASVEAVKE